MDERDSVAELVDGSFDMAAAIRVLAGAVLELRAARAFGTRESRNGAEVAEPAAAGPAGTPALPGAAMAAETEAGPSQRDASPAGARAKR